MWVKKEYNFLDLKKECNAKAISIIYLKRINKKDKDII